MPEKTMLIKPVAAAVGFAFVSSLTITSTVAASDNPFAAADLDSGYLFAGEGDTQEGKCGEDKGEDGKCGEGKCGENKGEDGKCGEGKCGENKGEEGKCGEGKCGEDKAAEAEPAADQS